MSFEYRLFYWLVDRVKNNVFFLRIKKSLISIRSKELYTLYIARMFFLTFISFLLGLTLLLLPINLPKNISQLKYLFPIIFPATTFLILYTLPLQKELEYRRSIENNLLNFVLHLTSLAESNIQPYLMFKIISKFDEYEAISKEMKELVKRVENYGEDFLSALKNIAKTNCSPLFQKILNNIASIIETGGDLKNYLKITYDYLMFDWKIKREEFLQRLSTISEIYVGLVISSPLFIISMIVVMAAIQTNIGFISLIDLLKILSYIVLPFLNVLFLFIIKGVEVEI
ncbi:MAG: type II secretion system F family protein [Candidatus Aenigmatarchaeota archaeon]